MGCFNRTGFYSHLPITAGDDIVMFLCVDTLTKKTRRDECPLSIIGDSIVPIAMPFFGKYDDYGGIEDVVDDANHQYFTKRVGMPLDKFCHLLDDFSCLSISEMEGEIEAIKSGEREENKVHLETVEGYTNFINLLKQIFGQEPKKLQKEVGEGADEINKFYEEMYEHELDKYNNTSLCLIMEHKSIYDKMVEIGRANYGKGWFYYKLVKPEDAFDFTIDVFKKYEDEIGKENPMCFGTDSFIRLSLGFHEEERKGLYKFLGSHCVLGDSFYFDTFDHCFYNGIGKDLEPMKDLVVNYIYFLSTFKRTCTTFNFSPYHTQEVSYERLIPIYEEMLKTLKSKYGEC